MRKRLILRALHALIRAQLRQRDYLNAEEITELEQVEQELKDLTIPAGEFYIYGRSCKECGGGDLRVSAGVVKCFNCQAVQSTYA